MDNNKIQLFESKRIRSVWMEGEEEWYFSIVDVVAVLTESPNPRKYWSVLKTRLKQEGSQLATNCSQLKMPSSDGKSLHNDVCPEFRLPLCNDGCPATKRRILCISLRMGIAGNAPTHTANYLTTYTPLGKCYMAVNIRN